jgi:hypothetical protein
MNPLLILVELTEAYTALTQLDPTALTRLNPGSKATRLGGGVEWLRAYLLSHHDAPAWLAEYNRHFDLAPAARPADCALPVNPMILITMLRAQLSRVSALGPAEELVDTIETRLDLIHLILREHSQGRRWTRELFAFEDAQQELRPGGALQ